MSAISLMKQPLTASACLVVTIMTAACTSAIRGNAASRTVEPQHHNVITRDEIVRARVVTAYDAIAVLNANMLRGRRSTPFEDSHPPVYLDGLPFDQGIGILKQIDASSVVEICYLNAADATSRYGTGHTLGAIIVSTAGSSSTKKCN